MKKNLKKKINITNNKNNQLKLFYKYERNYIFYYFSNFKED